jgi:thiamine-phosphate pyrophosphorylase
VTDPRWPLATLESVIEAAAGALGQGVFGVQLRDKSAKSEELVRTAARLRAATSRAGALFVVNAPTDEALAIALDAGADGVHLPCDADRVGAARARLGNGAWISVPAHTDEDVMTARSASATGVLVSPIFNSPGKGPARGVDALVRARACGGDLVVLALGGVDGSRAAACAEAGAHGVAVIRALLDAADPASVARSLDAPFHAMGAGALASRPPMAGRPDGV